METTYLEQLFLFRWLKLVVLFFYLPVASRSNLSDLTYVFWDHHLKDNEIYITNLYRYREILK